MVHVNALKSGVLNFNESFISYESTEIANRQTFRWTSDLGPFKLYHQVKGTGFSFGSNGLPTGGTATSIGIRRQQGRAEPRVLGNADVRERPCHLGRRSHGLW